MRRLRPAVHAWVVILLVVLLAALSPVGARAQSPLPYAFHDDREMDDLVASVALYSDPLLYHVLLAATFPEQLAAASEWADGHQYLSGKGLTNAMLEDHLPWEPGVQALLPFPAVLHMLTHDINWSTDLGIAYMAQRVDFMDALQRMRHRAQNNGVLRSDSDVGLHGKKYIEITLVHRNLFVVPSYDPEIAFAPSGAGLDSGSKLTITNVIRIGPEFDPWGWSGSRIHWSEHELTIYLPAPRYGPEAQVESHQLSPLNHPD